MAARPLMNTLSATSFPPVSDPCPGKDPDFGDSREDPCVGSPRPSGADPPRGAWERRDILRLHEAFAPGAHGRDTGAQAGHRLIEG